MGRGEGGGEGAPRNVLGKHVRTEKMSEKVYFSEWFEIQVYLNQQRCEKGYVFPY